MSSVPQMIAVGTTRRRAARELVVRVEVREELREHLERGPREHLVDELDVGRGHLVAERELVGDQEADVGAAAAGAVDELGRPARAPAIGALGDRPLTASGSSG